MPIQNGSEYIESLRNRNLQVYLFGDLVKEPVDHPMIRPSINAVAATYDIAVEDPEIGSATSSLTGLKVNRFLHIAESSQDLVNQNRMQRKTWTTNWNLLSTLCGNGCLKLIVFYNL